ncbi:MAG TPA: GxxExxY protein [Verrucomicrobiae bacterium]|nr:GxxExxY protein [Verrucomicrobiae bacterium]
MTENEIGKVVVEAAVKVHRELGPGLLEMVHEVVLARELERRYRAGGQWAFRGNLGVFASLRETKVTSEPGG